MSSVYNLEPPTKGKVILKTSLGDLEACRNFVQMCLEGYYDNTIFHRIIKDYLIQGGDPSGTGEGSESIYGDLFKDEFHTRLKFTHRGLVACANQNRPNSNGSQFFITLEKTEWLDRQNTIFGKIVGDTVYNLLRIGECATDEGDRPLEPPVIRKVEVVWNPFDDIVPRRDRAAEREAAKEAEAAAAAAAKRRSSKKNLGLLSFGEEAEEEDQQAGGGATGSAVATKIRSAHDVLEDRRLAKDEETPADERIVVDRPTKRSAEEEERVAKAVNLTKAAMDAAFKERGKGSGSRAQLTSVDLSVGTVEGDSGSVKISAKDFGRAMHEQMMERRRDLGDMQKDSSADGSVGKINDSTQDAEGSDDNEMNEMEEEDLNEEEEKAESRPKSLQDERRERFEALKRDNQRKGIGRLKAPDEVENADLLKPWQLAREKYKQRKRLVGDREKSTLMKLQKFSQALKSSDAEKTSNLEPSTSLTGEKDEVGGEIEKAGYNGKVRNDIDHKEYLPASWRVDDYLDREDLDASLDDLRTHRLAFTKHSGRVDDMARNVTENVDDYIVYDPLLEKGKGKFSKAEQEKKKRKNEWSGKANQ
ncbi:hypothetical protein CEUSTIGMA_g4972.t1 [Chlamydomonas eustigma]|uniref:PPIase cyclophilin-type domain-containing protein n=1 Tax=Chlamydomonas eustigma TaxID=1157962 RepID=A0A250X379_9CHLO|nr:hypothetical protein CEUSTIGMA_g4972.t1 [Chlamydomonas eustigma]|eukprot:GAX77528.1 hypothetical protein CEUSTIGMA_g4972.t1 [Chlamydomonas eustigma]